MILAVCGLGARLPARLGPGCELGARAAVGSPPGRLRSALHYAAGSGNLACTKLLCEAGADLNLGEKDGAPTPA